MDAYKKLSLRLHALYEINKYLMYNNRRILSKVEVSDTKPYRTLPQK